MLKDSSYETILRKFVSNKQERDEFRQELHLQLCEHNREKLIDYWNRGVFKWIYTRIVSNNIKSRTSKWHYHHRVPKQNEVGFIENMSNYEELCEKEIETEFEMDELDLIDLVIANKIKEKPLLVKEFTHFKWYYYENKTYDEISKMTTIPLMTVYSYVRRAEDLIRKEIKKYK